MTHDYTYNEIQEAKKRINNIGRILMYGTPFYMALLFRCLQLMRHGCKMS